ncbi:MAG: mechanosensitive ion channel [Flavobacteriales bacterium]|nr:mechanosensitive ion channel [Flavobacteriales bacterium]MCB9198018.1 mechanosensitive ion channel [Flavobacteriales bacterium]
MSLNVLEIRLLITAVILVVYIVLRLITIKILRQIRAKFNYSVRRYKSIKKIFLLTLGIIAVLALLLVWGVDKSQLFVFMSSMLTVFGIAFIAKWSILSNITASFILFFNHPIKIGDRICVLDKDFNIDGIISDIGIFYLHVRLENKEEIIIPTNIFLDKMVKTFES